MRGLKNLQALFYFISKFFPDATNRGKLRFGGKSIEVDIMIESIGWIIEYDGSFWHSEKIVKDNIKNKAINLLGYKILRVREYGLDPLDPFDGEVIDLPYEHINENSLNFIN